MDNAKVPRGPRRGRALSFEYQGKAMGMGQFESMLMRIPPEHQLFFRTLVSTGARWSEAAAWQKKDLVPDEQILKVRRVVSGGVEYQPKTDKSRRNIPISESLTQELADLVKFFDDDDLIFSTPDKKALSYDKMKKQVAAE